jgi:hypothetical protein
LEEELTNHYSGFFDDVDCEANAERWDRNPDMRERHFRAIASAIAPLLRKRGFVRDRCCSEWKCPCSLRWQRVSKVEEKKEEKILKKSKKEERKKDRQS